jgi:tetratricopeptide (TPR) repeat protein
MGWLCGNLAVVLAEQGKLAEAEAAMREGLAVQKALSASGRPEPVTLDDLAAILRDQGKLAEAEACLREALGLVRTPDADVSQETPQFGVISHHLAIVLRLQKAFPEARSLAQESVEAYRRHPQWSAPERHHALLVLGDVLAAMGDAAGLEALYGEQPDLVVLDSLACLLRDQGKLSEAEARFREGLAAERTLREDPGSETSWFGVFSHHLADVLRLQKAFPEARSLARESVAAYRRHPQWHPNEKQHALRVLGAVLMDMGDSEGLDRFYQDQLAELRAQLAPDDPALAAAIAQFTLLRLTEGKFSAAELLARECLKIREQQLPDDWLTFNTRCMLGASLLGQKKYVEAEPLLLAGFEGMKKREEKIPAQGRPRLKEAMQNLARLYEETERSDQAAQWKQQLADFDLEHAAKQK